MYGLAQSTRNNAFMHGAGKKCLLSSTRIYWIPVEKELFQVQLHPYGPMKRYVYRDFSNRSRYIKSDLRKLWGMLLPSGSYAHYRYRSARSFYRDRHVGRQKDGTARRWLVLGPGPKHHALHDLREAAMDLPGIRDGGIRMHFAAIHRFVDTQPGQLPGQAVRHLYCA